ncbi:MAG: DNA polymerase I [Bacteroidia bacterium]|nr:DNA polymerase I [Bacteroidia bacterium]
MSEKKLFLLDAFALIYRAYFAFSQNHRVNSKGLNTSAIFGFTNTLLDVIRREKPSHLAVVFDTAAPTFRHEEFKAYKAQREEIPEDIELAIPWVIKVIEGFNIPVIGVDGFEADDVIGTLAKEAERAGFKTFMMTPDKDYGQLVSDNIFIYKPPRGGGGPEVLGPREVCERWNIKRVDQVIEILGLMGDSVDNIPGVPGVGEKTAMSLIKDFDTIDGLYQNTDKLKGKLKEKVENNKELALQSRRLATIVTNVPVHFDEHALKLDPPDKEKLKEVFSELEFRNLAQKVLGSEFYGTESTQVPVDLFGNPIENSVTKSKESSVSAPGTVEAVPNDQLQTITDVKHQYHLADSEEKIAELIRVLKKANTYCFDTETTGLDFSVMELVGLAFSVKAHEGWYMPVSTDQKKAREQVHRFKEIFEDESKEMVGQNIKFDLAVLRLYGMSIKNRLFDTMLAHYLLRPDMRHGMDLLAETYLKYTPVSIEALIGKKGKGQLSMRDVPVEQVKEYASEDADITFQLKHVFEPLLKENTTGALLEKVETPLISVLSAMEGEGIKVDAEVLREYSAELGKDIEKVEADIYKAAGLKFNISSPKQVGEVLFEKLRLVENAKKTKTGQYATGEDILEKLRSKHEVIDQILTYRELLKLKNTYVDALPEMVNPKTGRIHTTFNQVVAVTGRLSSDNPNLQNIPIRTERGREIRKAFVPRDNDHVLLSADYSQIELRVMAHMSGDEGMIQAFQEGMDIHTATAAKVFHVKPEDVSSEMRRRSKMVNFGIIYGISAFGLAERLNISRTESKEIIDNYFQQYSRIKEYMDECIVNAKKKGFVETILGRRRYLPDINSGNATVRGFAERNAINAPIQGSAADMIKIAMINLHNVLNEKKFKSRLILQVHDELVFDVHKTEVEKIQPVVKSLMEGAIQLKVPVLVEMGTGENWLAAH